MTAADLAQRVADALADLPIPAAAVLSISTTTGPSGATQLHLRIGDADAIADAIGDRSQEVVTRQQRGDATVWRHHLCPIRDRPGYALVWCA